MQILAGLLIWVIIISWFFGVRTAEWSFILKGLWAIITSPYVQKMLQIVPAVIALIIGSNVFKSSQRLKIRIYYGIALLLGVWGIFWTVGVDNLVYLLRAILDAFSRIKPSKTYYIPVVIIALIILTQQSIKYSKRLFKSLTTKLAKHLQMKRHEDQRISEETTRDSQVAIEKAFRFYLNRIEQTITSLNTLEGNNLNHSKRCTTLIELLNQIQGDPHIPKLPKKEHTIFLNNLKSKTKDLEKILERHQKTANPVIAEEIQKLIEKLSLVINAVKG